MKLIHNKTMIFLFLLLLSVFYHSSAPIQSTSATLSIDSVNFNKSQFSVNDTITISIGVNLNDFGSINYFEIVLYSIKYDITVASLDPTYDSDTGAYITNKKVTEYMPDGQYYVSRMFVGNASGLYFFYNGTNYSSPKVQITGTQPDIVPPQLNSVTIDNANVQPNDNVTVSVNATDDVSGIDYVSIWIKSAFTNGIFLQGHPQYNPTTKYYEYTFQVNQYWESTTLWVSRISINDLAGHQIVLNNGTDFNAPDIIITGTTPDYNPPTIGALSTNRTIAQPGDTIRFSASITDDVSGVQQASLAIRSVSQNREILYDDMIYNASSGLFEYYLKISLYYPFGNLYISEIDVSDMAGNSDVYHNGSDFSSPNVNVTGTIPDSEPPVLHSISFIHDYAYQGENISIIANISDNLAGVAYVAVSVYDVDSYLNFYFFEQDYYYFEPELQYNSTSGLYMGDIHIPAELVGRNLFISDVYIEDSVGNYNYLSNGTDFTAPVLNIYSPYSSIMSFQLDPDTGSSYQNNQTVFNFTLTNFDSKPQDNVSVKLSVLDDSNNLVDSQIYKRGRIVDIDSFSFTLTFNQTGTYELKFDITASLGRTWTYNTTWTVLENTSSSPTTTDTTSSLSSSTTTSSSMTTSPSETSTSGSSSLTHQSRKNSDANSAFLPILSVLIVLMGLGGISILRIRNK